MPPDPTSGIHAQLLQARPTPNEIASYAYVCGCRYGTWTLQDDRDNSKLLVVLYCHVFNLIINYIMIIITPRKLVLRTCAIFQ